MSTRLDKMVFSPQQAEVMTYLKQHGSITQEEARQKFHCWRLASRIAELREKLGYDVFETVRIPTKKSGGQFAKYVYKPQNIK